MIIISTQCFPPRTGGIETLMCSLARALHRSGREVMVFADGYGGETGFDQNQPFPVRRISGLKPLRRYKKAKAVAKAAAGAKAVIVDTWKSLERLKPQEDRPILCLVHGTELPMICSRRKKSRIQKALAKATAIIPNSQYTADRLKHFSVDNSKIHVIHPGIEPPEATTTDSPRELRPGDGPVLISVGRLEARKGIDTVINLMPRLVKKYPSLHYFILGGGSQKKLLEALVTKQGLVEQVTFIGPVDETTRNAYLRASDLFVLPGRTEGNDVEGFGIAFIEAAWFGIPAVAGRAGGAVEAVIHNQTGLVCDGSDPEAVHAAICRLLDNDALREQLGKTAERRARDFLWSDVIKSYFPLLDA